jgi:hypothetical protein
MAHSLSPVQEKRTMRELEVQIANSRISVPIREAKTEIPGNTGRLLWRKVC